jgi:hypothetical protein
LLKAPHQLKIALMDEGHFLTFGVVFAGSIFMVTALFGGVIIFYTVKSWSKNKTKNSEVSSSDLSSELSSETQKNNGI